MIVHKVYTPSKELYTIRISSMIMAMPDRNPRNCCGRTRSPFSKFRFIDLIDQAPLLREGALISRPESKHTAHLTTGLCFAGFAL